MPEALMECRVIDAATSYGLKFIRPTYRLGVTTIITVIMLNFVLLKQTLDW